MHTDKPVIRELAQLLNKKDVSERLKKQNVSPKQYALWAFDRQRRATDRAGYVGGGILIAILGGISFLAGFENGQTVMGGVWAGAAGAALGGVITWGALRKLHGKQSVYVSHPNDTTPGFSLLGIMHRFSASAMDKLSQADWERVQQHQPRYADAIYQRLPGEDAAQEKRKKLTSMTDGQLRLVETLKGIQTGAAWLIPLSLLTLVLDHFSFAWPSLFFAGAWFFLEGLIGFTERRIEGLGAGDVNIYGWPARVSAVVIMITAFLIGILPGILGVASELGVDLIDLFF